MYSRFVEIGRVAVVTCGPYAGKLVVIVDVINQTKVGWLSFISVDLAPVVNRCADEHIRGIGTVHAEGQLLSTVV